MFCNSQRDVFFFCAAAVLLLFLLLPLSWQRILPILLLLCLLRLAFCLDRLFARVDIFSLCVLFEEANSRNFPLHDDIEDKDNDDVNVNDASRIRIKERASERMRNVAVSFERCTTQKRCSKSFFLLNRQSRRRRPIREVTLCAL